MADIDVLFDRWQRAERAYDAADPLTDEAARLLSECEQARTEYEHAVGEAGADHGRVQQRPVQS